MNILSTRGVLEQGACLDALISIMLDSSANQMVCRLFFSYPLFVVLTFCYSILQSTSQTMTFFFSSWFLIMVNSTLLLYIFLFQLIKV